MRKSNYLPEFIITGRFSKNQLATLKIDVDMCFRKALTKLYNRIQERKIHFNDCRRLHQRHEISSGPFEVEEE